MQEEQFIVLIVQAPNRAGPVHEFLVASMLKSKFNEINWHKGDRDEIICTLGLMKQHGYGHFRAKKGIKSFVRTFEQSHEIKHPIHEVRINFIIPTHEEFAQAATRHNRLVTTNQISATSHEITCCEASIVTMKKRITDQQRVAKSPRITEGYRMHITHIELRDLQQTIVDIRGHIRKLKKLLVYQKKELETYNAEEATAPPTQPPHEP